MSTKKRPDEPAKQFEQPYLSKEMAQPRFEKQESFEDFGWATLQTKQTYDHDRDEVTSVEKILDLKPGAGVVLDTLEHKANLMGLDQVIEGLGHTAQLMSYVKARKGFLEKQLQDLARDNSSVEGDVYEAWWERGEKVLKTGLKRPKLTADQARLRREAE